jgi:hypothetical protein
MKIDAMNLEWWGAHELLVGAVVPRPIAFISTKCLFFESTLF